MECVSYIDKEKPVPLNRNTVSNCRLSYAASMSTGALGHKLLMRLCCGVWLWGKLRHKKLIINRGKHEPSNNHY